MTITPEQTIAIATQLSVDLALQTDDRLIELCLLHRSAPDAYPVFIDALDTEIERRFTALEIADNDVMFSVLQNFANQFVSPIPFFQQKMLEMAASVNRDIWFTNNLALFTDATNSNDLMAWLVTQTDVLTKTLHNQIALPILAQSTIAATAILTDANAVALFKDTPDIWSVWTQHSAGMTVIAQSSELMTYVINNIVAMTAVIASSTAMTAVAASSTAMTAVIASSTAMTAVIASSTAMTAVAASSTAMTAIVKSTSARNALMSNNTVFQSVKAQIYNTVKASWSKQASVTNSGSIPAAQVMTSAVANPVGIVLAQVHIFDNSGPYNQNITHSNGVVALNVTRFAGSAPPLSLSVIDVISFNGVVFTGSSSGAYGYAELWIPPV